MKVFDLTALEAEPVDPATFSGGGTVVRMEHVSERPLVNAYRVTFEPRTRTAWHTHSGTQLLIVTDGTCRFQKAGEPVRELRAGGIISIMAGSRHWHGATPDAPMTHVALNIDAQTAWLEQVTDREYAG